MALVFFWLKIAAKRIVRLIKDYPVIIIGTVVILAAFFIARNHLKRYMDMRTEIIVLSFFAFVSLLLSLSNYRTMPTLMVYAKSGLRNKQIRLRFFLKQALAINALFLLHGFFSFTGILITESFMALPVAFFLSLLFSVSLMYLKNEYNSKKVNRIVVKKTVFKAAIKGVICDYFSSGFLPMAVLSIGLFIAVAVLLTGDIRNLHELENPLLIFIILLILLSIGFLGIIESVSNINWKFHSIIFPHDFAWHMKRITLFLGVLFCLPILFYFFLAFFFGFALLLKYLYCTVVVLLLSINIAFMSSGRSVLLRGIVLSSLMFFTVWISMLQTAFLLILLVPVLITFFKANSEYKEWYYL